jgi:hypothetical protein
MRKRKDVEAEIEVVKMMLEYRVEEKKKLYKGDEKAYEKEIDGILDFLNDLLKERDQLKE